jgi:tRNA U34 5-methylaminomethyl-2-thiouridine-forming methyltransferase MnmC
MNSTKYLTPKLTADGSLTFFSSEFNESFHSLYGARQEAELKFVEPTGLVVRKQPVLKLLDICYGLGYNSAAALEAIWTANPTCQVQLIGLELDATVPKAAIAHGFLNLWSERVQQAVATLASDHQIQTTGLEAQLLIGDARQTIQQLHQNAFFADAIFLDPFSPARCPQLWTVEFLNWVACCLQPMGRLATYSCAAAVRMALLEAGLKIGSTPPVGRRSPGTVASFASTDLPQLSQQEQEHLATRAAIPHRDPRLCDSTELILHRRRIEQQASTLESTSQWKQRWFQA